MKNPFGSFVYRHWEVRSRRGFDVREDKDRSGGHARAWEGGCEVFVEQNTLIIKGEGGDKESGYDDSDRESGGGHSSRIDVPQSCTNWMKSRQR
ncbi:LOW QUALITY PROTEIN: small heat shock protein, chloroplastic [Cinnamomum micranthum f. kanehirae]|uniref:Small heat shock protein, chloroplastic n=1 Tax=Cinnamomum micranthum f. kanehirae TaxID=337451 RepID=A0A443Q5G9_9MAGN|nr:LOW QUALITY PROTEIN: small heat shock protein, chloroplastic [Cinnamomum micranthum f. kanehirae]